MTTLTEQTHAGAYLGSVVDRQLSFETATVKSGQNLKAGEVLQWDTGKLVAHAGVLVSDGGLSAAVAGILHQAVDASAGDIEGQVYLARGPATVKDDLITYPAESSDGGEKAAIVADLKDRLFIAPR